jgi:replicative DNA helicase
MLLGGRLVVLDPRPWLQVAANALDQTDNLYKQFVDMVAEGGAVDDFYLDLGVTRTTTRSGGLIEPVTSEAGTREGQPISGAALEEALDIDTPLPTPSGWTTMGEVQIGDELIGAARGACGHRQGDRRRERAKAYRVTFEDGSTVIASAGHLWLTRVAGRSDRPAKVRTTHELVSGGQRYRVPARAGIEGKAVDLDIDPYVLGCWLGDGDSRNATITGSEADLAEIELNIQAAGYTTRRLSTRDRSPAIYVSVPGSTRNRFSKERGLKVRLAQAGLLGNKHIPAEYLRTSRLSA